MKVLHQDTRTNEIKLRPETIDDLWHMSNLLDESDLVYASTYRRKEDKGDKLRPERTEKIRMRLGIRVKKVEFHESEDRLRLLGEIESGPQDVGQHHTLMIGVGDDITIVKTEWKQAYLERIKRAVEASEKPSIVFVAIEDTEAVIAMAREYGFKESATITRNPEGKMYESKSNEEAYLDEVVDKVVPIVNGEPLVILGPGFTKESLAHRIREKHPDLQSEIILLSTGQAGMAGVHEAMKRGLGGKAVENSRVARETRLVEQLFSEIGSDGLFAYGMQSVRTAAEAGAVKTLLVLDEKVRTDEADTMLRLVENSRGEFVIISSLHEAGRRLESLGGIAAILRYPIA
ncbi:MAG: mRNA surveillance protein pelota [Thermoplasmata archaeon]|nr:mRNA surveillance protein pelota [Thermoplasmata archaeon]